MSRQPDWRSEANGDDVDVREGDEVEPTVTCKFQDGTLSIFDDHVRIERAGPSKFEDKTIPREEVTDVTYSKGIAIGFLQIEQAGFVNDTKGFLSSPVDENTLHFGRGARDCAERARDELLFGES